MNFFQRYMDSATRSPEDGSGSIAPTAPSGGDAPAAGSAAPVAESSAPSSVNEFSDFGDTDEFDSIDLGAETVPSPEPPVAAPVAAPVVPAPAPAAPAPAEVVPAQATPDPKETAASAPPPSELDTLVQSIDGNSKELAQWLAENAFALSKEEADAFELDAVANVPRLMARVAVNNMKSTMNIVKNLVPKMIAAEVAKISSSQTKAKEAISEFYSANPHLNEEKHGALVTKWANAYRAANPKASRKEAIEYVGKAVSFEAGIAPGTKAPIAAPAPFQPARPGGRQPIATSTEPSPYVGLGMDHDEG